VLGARPTRQAVTIQAERSRPLPNWSHVTKEIAKAKATAGSSAFDIVRRKYLAQLQQHTGRNIICYYSGFLTKPGLPDTEISDDDKNGFMLCVTSLTGQRAWT
jgi:hypothetical protein